jgi:hypothetical protein
MKTILSKPKCIDEMGSDLFVTMPIYQELNDYPVIYINKELYKKIFNKEYDFKEASKDIKKMFSVTLKDNGTDSIGLSYIDKQADPSGISLSNNLGSGRAYYVGSNYNIKGEKTILCTSTNPDYNNGKYPLEAAFQETIISEVLNSLFDVGNFRVLAIIDTKEMFKFPKSVNELACGRLIRYYENNELYRFSHLFVNNKKLTKKQIIDICKKMGIIEGNKITQRFLHGAWSLGNISIDSNLIDFDTSFFVDSRSPSWIYTLYHKENYFGHEDDGQKRIIDILLDNNMITEKVDKEELYKIIDEEKNKKITSGFLELIGYDNSIYSKYKKSVDELVSLFTKLYGKMVFNYDKMNITNYQIEMNNLFDFSKFFKFYNIYINYYDYSFSDLTSLLFNHKTRVFQYEEIDKNIYDYEYSFLKEDVVNNSVDMDNVFNEAKTFIKKFHDFNNKVDSELKINIKDKIRKCYLINETKKYLLATTWLRGGLCRINDKYNPELVNYIIQFVIDYYTQKDYNEYLSDLVIFEQGMFYRNIKNNSYTYVYKTYNDCDYDQIEVKIDNEIIELHKVDNNKYESDIIEELRLNEIKDIYLMSNNIGLKLNIVDFIDNL